MQQRNLQLCLIIATILPLLLPRFPPERTDYGASPTKTTCVTYSNENTRITCDSGEEIEEVSSSKLRSFQPRNYLKEITEEEEDRRIRKR